MKDYRKLVSRTPPEGLLAPAVLDTAGLVYEMEWVRDGSIETMLTNPGKKTKAVRCTCSECGLSAVLAYAPPDFGYRDGKECYGFFHPENGEPVRDGDSTLCPVCGNPVTVRCAARVGGGEFTADEDRVMSAALLPGAPGERPLVLTGWSIRRLVNRYGWERFDIRPLEAYVFERDTAVKLNGWVNSYSGTAGYFVSVCRVWRQPQKWSESWGGVKSVFGLTAELVAESCLHNSKLDVYMAETGWTEWKHPVPYLRLCQTYPQIENLVVQDCGPLLDRLFDEEMERSDWGNNHEGLMKLPELHFEEKRPSGILGLTREEFRVMRDQCWDLYHWRIYTKAKAVGDRMKLPEDITLLHQYGGEDIEWIIGRAPVGKTLRYLLRAMREYAGVNDIYNEYAEYVADDDALGADLLADYWNMAEQAGWDLTDPEIKWPKNLFTAHDRAMAAGKAARTKKLVREFKARAAHLARFAYASGPLEIHPAGSQKALNREGKLLHHCVAGYGEDVALGRTAIFFIRHTWEPGKPYFTLEFDEEKETVKQNRGKYNCARTAEVEAFEKEWLAWVKKGCKRKKDGTPYGAKPPVKENPDKKKKEAHAA